MMTITDWIGAVAAVATVLVAIVAIFQDKIRSWLWSPELSLSIVAQSPDCVKTELTRTVAALQPEHQAMISEKYPEISADVYYLRVRVTNDGNVAAKNVEVFASELKKKRAGEGFVTVNSFLPMNLVWSQIDEIYAPQIAPDMHRHCDVARVIDPELRHEFKPSDKTWDEVDPQAPILDISTHAKVNTLPHLVPAGTYRLTIIAAGANTKPVTATIEITLKSWYASTERMLTDGIGVEIVE